MKRFLVGFLSLCILISVLLCGCRPFFGDEPQVTLQPQKGTDMDSEVESMERRAGASSAEVFYAKDFGAVGDGVTDDGPAMDKAVDAAAKAHGTLVFEEGKRYYVGSSKHRSNGFVSPFSLNEKESLTIDGCGSTFVMKPGLCYFAASSCSDIRFRNMVFDLSVSEYLVGTVKETAGYTVVYDTDLEPNLKMDRSCAFNNCGFSIAYNEGLQQRPHRFFAEMKRTGEKEVTVTYNQSPDVCLGDKVFLPNPDVGHMFGEMIYLAGCGGQMICENIRVASAPTFVFNVRDNTADFLFDNVDLLPAEDNDREIRMVSWRDGFHCKNNRGRLVWYHCDFGVLFDDVITQSNNLGKVLKVEEKNRLLVTNLELYNMGISSSFDIKPGDVADIYDTAFGKFIGTATVTDVKNEKNGVLVTFDRELKRVDTLSVVANRNTGAPGSLISCSNLQGTMRLRGSTTLRNDNMAMLALWIMAEGDVEGPLPRDMYFENCHIFGGAVEVNCYDRVENVYSEEIGRHIENIRFKGCRIESEIVSSTGAEILIEK